MMWIPVVIKVKHRMAVELGDERGGWRLLPRESDQCSSTSLVLNVPALTAFTMCLGPWGTPHIEAPVKLSKIDAALIGVAASKGPPFSDPAMPTSDTSETGTVSVPFDVPSSSGSHLTVSLPAVVVGVVAEL